MTRPEGVRINHRCAMSNSGLLPCEVIAKAILDATNHAAYESRRRTHVDLASNGPAGKPKRPRSKRYLHKGGGRAPSAPVVHVPTRDWGE